MAYRVRKEDEEQFNSNNSEQSLSSGPIQLAGSTAPAASVTPQQTTTAPTRKTSSGTFQNLMGFLDANRDQAQGLGTNVANTINKEIGEGQTALNTAGTQFGEEVKAGTNVYDPNLTARTLANPMEVTPEFTRQLAGEYKGPSSVQESNVYQPLVKEIGDVNEINTLGESSGGRKQLLTRTFQQSGKNNRGFGYDQFLLENTKPAWEKVSSALDSTKPYQEALNQKTSELNKMVDPAVAASKAAGEQTKQAVVSEQDKIKQAVDQRVIDKIASEKQTQEAVRAAIEKGDFSTLKQLGATDQDIADLQKAQKATTIFDEGITETSFLDTANPEAIYNPKNVATQEEAQRWSGLNKLIGGTGNYLDPNIANPESSTKFNVKGLENAYQQTVINGMLADEARRAVGRGEFATIEEANAAMKKAVDKQNTTNYISTGASIGSYFGPWGTVIGAAVGAIVGIFGKSKDTQGTKDYKAYKRTAEEAAGRDMSETQIGGAFYNTLKENRKNEQLQSLASAFGIGGRFDKKADNTAMLVALGDFVGKTIKQAQADGILPTDPAQLKRIGEKRMYERILAPAFDKLVSDKTGQPYGGFASYKGVVPNMIADMTDWWIANNRV